MVAATATTVRDAFGARFVHVLDLQAVDVAAARAVMAAALDDPQGAVGAATIGLPHSRLARLVRLCGFRRLPALLEPNRQMLGVFDNGAETDVLDRRYWTVAWADLDHL